MCRQLAATSTAQRLTLGVAVPVDRVVALEPEHGVEQALVARVDQLPDEADQRQREHDRQEERALVEPGEPELLVQQDGEEHARARVGDRERDGQPDQVVLRAPARTAGRS